MVVQQNLFKPSLMHVGTLKPALSVGRSGSTYPGRLEMLSKLVHSGVGDGHIPEHALQFRGELASTFSLSSGAKH